MLKAANHEEEESRATSLPLPKTHPSPNCHITDKLANKENNGHGQLKKPCVIKLKKL